MSEFYAWPLAARLAITLIFALCVLSQTLAAALNFYRRRSAVERVFENALELSVLAQIIVISMMHGQVMQAIDTGLLPETGYADLRVAVFVAAALSAAATIVLTRDPKRIVLIVAAGLTLPLLERFTGRIFAFLYMAALLFWFVRSIRVASLCYAEIKGTLSALSIKNTLNSLHTGVMFCESDGFAVLTNTQMLRLMKIITGKSHRNGRHFFGLLTLEKIEPDCEVSWFEGQNVCLLPDGTAWRLSIAELASGRKKYYQLTAAEVTERWKLTSLLRPKREELLLRQKELNETIVNLHALTREIETQKAKMRVHDILGERLTLLLRSVRGEQAPNFGLLRVLAQGLLEDIKAIQIPPSPQDEFDSLRQTFGFVGVEMLAGGELPDDDDIGRLMVDVIREAVINAVRHGFATQVNILAGGAGGEYFLEITDNGHPPEGEVAEGGGITGIRRKVEPFGGTVAITASPRFTLSVTLPKSGKG